MEHSVRNWPSLPENAHDSIRRFYEIWKRFGTISNISRQSDFWVDATKPYWNGMSLAEFDHDSETLVYKSVSPFLVERFSTDPTGKPIRDFYRGSDWLEVWRNYFYVIDKQRPIYNRSEVLSTRNKPKSIETLYLPVEAELANATHILTYSV